ncbi:MAG: autotransporter-associated beta strand repeat-containing protein, partial [Muribaculum sp.]|nr:autotransporter-associated beta strand repeat-containing protein [Muribaculum sp.]
GVFCSWRINADEWDNNTFYNIYRGGTKLNDTPLRVSNFTDKSGSLDATYTVRPVTNGVEGDECAQVKPWEKNYTIIVPKHAAEITPGLLQPNDATAADVDGDGQLEIIMKYDNFHESFHDGDNGIFTVIECLKLDGTVLWWINCGPNMGDFQNNEINIAAYDWDGDGRAEVVFRAADGTQIHQADGTIYTVGDPSLNYRGYEWPGGQWFMCAGKEYLIYADGLTGKPYEDIEYPLKRVEDKDNPKGLLEGGEYAGLISNEWGDGYGHRSSKYFFAAPYLDGRRPSIFLARGIYTKHKMITYDVDPATHKLKERWRWNDLGAGTPWFAQGYHNMGIADVDWDGRDEIVFGSMVIDDNGFGLSTSGLGHGDSQHCGDFDPYSHGQEIFACNEHQPNNNFRDATTSKIYYRTTGDRDDGRANCGNFIDKYPGSEGISSRDNALVCGASHKAVVGDDKGTTGVITQNFRVFWDGDLCDETFDYSNGKNTAGGIYKAYEGLIATLEGSKTNNDTKGTPCFQGDILGDWREEYIMRDKENNIRIYTTDYPTEHRIYSLWYDHQYRNAMVWQMGGYNQTPHVSFALSEFEDITVPPMPLTTTGREIVGNGSTISESLNGKNVFVGENDNITVSAGEGVSPALLVVNAPTWVQGHNDNNNITTKSYTHTISSGLFAGDMKLVKQGDGKLIMPEGYHTYSGCTEVWAGTLSLGKGGFKNSPVWLNRFAVLEGNDLTLDKGLDMNYGSVLKLGVDLPGSKASAGVLTADSLRLGFGAILELDVFEGGSNADIDHINVNKLIVEKKDWENGPEYLQPIVKLTAHPAGGKDVLESGIFKIGTAGEIEGKISDIILQGIDDMQKRLYAENGTLYLELEAFEPGDKTWAGGEDAVWNLSNSASFTNTGNAGDVFVPGDNVVFDDNALTTDVVIEGKLKPASVTFRNETKDYTLSGEGRIVGDTKLTKEGAGTLTISNINEYSGGTYINGGKVVAGVFANEIGVNYGALSDVDSRIYISNNATLAVNTDATLGQRITMSNGNAALEVPDGLKLVLAKGVSASGIGQRLIKKGKGTLNLAGNNGMTRLVIEEGTVIDSEVDGVISLPGTVEFIDGTLRDADNSGSYTTNKTNFVVAEGNSGTLRLDPRCNYTGKLTGKGKFTVQTCWIRHYLNGDWSGFEGELVVGDGATDGNKYNLDFDNDFGMGKATLNISSGMTFNAGAHNMKLSNLKGLGTYLGTGTLTIGNDETAINFPGSFSEKPKIVKIGKCDMYLSKLMENVSSLTSRDGSVSLNASKAPYNTTYLEAPLVIEGNSTLRGRGTVADINVSGNGILAPGTYSGDHRYGPIFSTGNVTINPGATLSLYLRVAGKGNDCSYIDVAGMLKIDGNVIVDMNPGYEPAEGDQFQLWKASKFSGTPALELPELPEGLEWDA